MRKVSDPFKRKDRSGWWIRWFDGGRKRLKCCGTKAEARMFRENLYRDLNRDVYRAMPIRLDDAVEKFKDHCRSGLKKSSMAQYEALFKTFKETCGHVIYTSDLTAAAIQLYINARLKTLSTWTVKKNLKQLQTFVCWLSESGYETGRIVWPPIKTGPSQKGKILSEKDCYECFLRCQDKNEQLNFMLSLCTGLRKTDIGLLDAISDDISGQYANKTGKHIDAPVPPVLAQYGKGEILVKLSRKKWERIMGEFTHHDLRRTNAQFINDAGNLDIASELLQHSSTKITKDFYLKAGKRAAVNAVFEPMFAGWL